MTVPPHTRSTPGGHGERDATTLLDIALSATISRHRYGRDAETLIAELRTRAGARTDTLDVVVGQWAGYYRDAYTGTICDALLRAFPGALDHVAIGEQRRAAGVHGTAGHAKPPGL